MKDFLALITASLFLLSVFGCEGRLQGSSNSGHGSAGRLWIESVEKLSPDQVAPLAWFTGDRPESVIANGSFEEWYPASAYPAQWAFLVVEPSVEKATEPVKFGSVSMKLSSTKEARVQPLTAPPIEKLRGRVVLFGAWLYTDSPNDVAIQIIDGWKQYHVARPTQAGAWELVTMQTTIPQSAEAIFFAIAVGKGAAPATCYVDGAALVVIGGETVPQ